MIWGYIGIFIQGIIGALACYFMFYFLFKIFIPAMWKIEDWIALKTHK